MKLTNAQWFWIGMFVLAFIASTFTLHALIGKYFYWHIPTELAMDFPYFPISFIQLMFMIIGAIVSIVSVIVGIQLLNEKLNSL